MANEESKVISLHSNIRNVFDFVKYLDKRLNGEEFYQATNLDNKSIAGYLEGHKFYIEFIHENASDCSIIELVMERGDTEVLKRMERTIAPILWSSKSKQNGRPRYCSKIFSYEFYSQSDFCLYDAVVWDTINPKKTIESFLDEALSKDGSSIFNEEIYYPYINVDEILKKKYFQIYPGNIRPETVKRIQTMSEFEVFYEIKKLNEKYNAYNEQNENKNPSIDLNFKYVLSFLFAQTKRFGVKVKPPSDEFREPSFEQKAWYSMWDEYFTMQLKLNPNLQNDWKESFEGGFDPNFRPQTTLQDYYKYYEEMLEKETAIKLKAEEEIAKRKLKEIKEEVKRQKSIEAERNKTLDGRVENLFEEVLRDSRPTKGESKFDINNFSNF